MPASPTALYSTSKPKARVKKEFHPNQDVFEAAETVKKWLQQWRASEATDTESIAQSMSAAAGRIKKSRPNLEELQDAEDKMENKLSSGLCGRVESIYLQKELSKIRGTIDFEKSQIEGDKQLITELADHVKESLGCL